MSQENSSEILTGDSLLKASLHLRIFAAAIITVLSTGIVVIVHGQLRQGGPLADAVENPSELLRGFVFLILLTAGYLVGKSWTTSRIQRRVEREPGKWLENRFEATSSPELRLRSFSSSGLDTASDRVESS